MVDEQILHDCMAQLRTLPRVKEVVLVRGRRGRTVSEVEVLLGVKTDMGRMRFAVQIKPALGQPVPEHLAIAGQRAGEPSLVMTRCVSPSLAESLKEHQINFIDTCGNAFISVPKFIHVDVWGRKVAPGREARRSALFRPKPLQLLFVLLTDEKALGETIRALRPKAGISFGRTATAMKELKDRGFVREGAGQKLEFVDKKALLEQWLVTYGEQLRPKLVLGQYKMAPSVQERTAEILAGWLPARAESYAMGGSLGAYLLTKYYRGPTTEIFVRPDRLVDLRGSLGLIPAADPNTTLFNLFSPSVIYPTKLTRFPVVHPLLIYAELLHHGGSRDKEAAKVVYDSFLKRRFDEHRTRS